MPIFAASDGANLFYTDDGHGVPLVCLAGLTRNASDFDYVLPHLPPLRLIRLDYRGRGRSDWTGADSYTIVQEGADVLALLDHLGLESAAILGTSRGGLIGMYLSAVAPDRVRGLCLNDVGPVFEAKGLARISGYIGKRPQARSHAAAAVALQHAMAGFDVPATRWMEEAKKHFIQTSQGLDLNYDPALRLAFEAAMKAPPVDLWPMFMACAGKPLGVIRGENSDLLSAATVAQMQARVPAMIETEVPGRAHVPFLDEPESITLIHRFLGLLI